MGKGYIRHDFEKHKILDTSRHLNDKYWWTDEIRKLWEIKNHKQTLFNRYKSPFVCIELRKAQNRLKNLIRITRREKWEEYLNNLNPSINRTEIWRDIKKFKNQNYQHNTILNQHNKALEFLNHNFVAGSISNK